LLLSDANCLGEVKLKSVATWGNELFDDMKQVAQLLDKANQTTQYSESITRERAKINDASLTPSAKILSIMIEEEQSLSNYSLQLASKYRDETLARDYQYYSQQYFIDAAEKSHQEQRNIEANDKLSFDEFLVNYFK